MENQRLYVTMVCGRAVGIYERPHKRLLVKYENSGIDGGDYAFTADYGSNGVEDVLSEYIRKLVSTNEEFALKT